MNYALIGRLQPRRNDRDTFGELVPMNDKARLNSALDTHPNLARVIRRLKDYEPRLLADWWRGADTGEIHPAIQLIFADDETRAMDLEAGLASIHLSDHVEADFARRIVGGSIAEHRDSGAALTELLVGGKLARAGATVTFIPRGKTPMPDIAASRNGVTVTLEVSSGNVSDADRDADVGDAKAFHTWAAGTPKPALKRGEASDYGAVRFLTKTVLPFGSGTFGTMVGRLATKKVDTQLVGHSNPILVRSFWHLFGVGRELCSENIGSAASPRTGLLYAATYGYEGDPIFEGETFEGEPMVYSQQAGAGILTRSAVVAGVLWLFEKDSPVLLESPDVHLEAPARELLLDAFDLRSDTVSRVKSSRSLAHDEIAVAAYLRWRGRGGAEAPEQSMTDWLRAERSLRLKPPIGP